MKIADVLRKVAELIDDNDDQPADNNPAVEPVTGLQNVDTSSPQPDGDELMIPPLQLKMELLKRAVGVDNVYDPGEARDDEAHENQGDDQECDEIEMLKARAGIPQGVPTAAVMELSNDELLDD